jgi:hypothetical protein
MVVVVVGLQDGEPRRVADLAVALTVVRDVAAGGAERFNDLDHDNSPIVLACRTSDGSMSK